MIDRTNALRIRLEACRGVAQRPRSSPTVREGLDADAGTSCGPSLTGGLLRGVLSRFGGIRRSFDRLFGSALMALAVVVLNSGCAQNVLPAVKPLRSTILVMDFAVDEELRGDTTRNQIEGWWFGSHSRFENPNSGRIFAETLSKIMRKEMDFAQLFDRLRLRQYFARKYKILEDEFSNLETVEIDALMNQVSPLSFARELGADKIIVGRMVRSKSYVNRTVKYWSSTVQIECSMLDVDSGKTLWRYTDEKTGRLDSQKKVMEDIAARLVDDLRENYFYKP